jgi:cytoskeletal protein RodZ
MKEIGAKLRAARETKNMTLAQVQEQTKIRLRYLEALESGVWEVIPGEVYRRGFIGIFANAVGLNGEALLREYDQAKEAQLGEPTHKGSTSASATEPVVVARPPTVVTSDVDSIKRQKVGWIPLLVILGLILAGILVAGRLTGGLSQNKAVLKEPPLVGAPNGAQASMLKTAEPEATNGENVGHPATTIVQQLYPAPITVYAEFNEMVWVQVRADSQVKYRDGGATFTAKSPKQLWTANQEMVIRVGNSAGLRLTLNGKELGSLGKRDQPRTITLTANGMAVQ